MFDNAIMNAMMMLALTDSIADRLAMTSEADRANDTVHKINQNNQDTTLLNTQRR